MKGNEIAVPCKRCEGEGNIDGVMCPDCLWFGTLLIPVAESPTKPRHHLRLVWSNPEGPSRDR